MKKPFPWGFAVGVVVLVLLLAGILVYAFTNTGSGFQTAADKADKAVPGLIVDKGLGRTHVTGKVNYARTPPDGGNHNAYPQTCAVYTQQIADEHAVHSLEHGAVWVTYRPDLPAAEVATLAALVQGNDYRLMSPYPGLPAPIVLVAWGRELRVNSATDPQVVKFLDTYTQGPQTPEPGSACSGTSKTGTDPTATNPDPAQASAAPTAEGGQPGLPSPTGSAAPTSSAAPTATATP